MRALVQPLGEVRTCVTPARRPATTAHVFVVGCPFSGATPLAWALGQHPSLRPLVGARMAGPLVTALGVLDDEILPLLEREVVGPLESLVTKVRGSQGQPTLRGDLAALLEPSSCTQSCVVGAADLARRVPAAQRLFPELRVIHVYRERQAVVQKLVERAWGKSGGLSPSEARTLWKNALQECLEAERHVGAERSLRLSYEELLHEPEDAIRRSLALLGREPSGGCLWPLRLLTTASPAGPRGVSAGPRLTPTPIARQSASGCPATPLRPRMRWLVEATVPEHATVLVASRGDDDLLRFDGRRGAHFPQLDDGTWAGFYPADGEAAVAQVEALAAGGASHLVFPQAALWWLAHYRELRLHLEQTGRLLAFDPEVAAVWELAPGRRLALPSVLQIEEPTPAEPDNAQAFAVVATTTAPRQRQQLRGSLWALAAYYNPAGYASKRENYATFRRGLERAGVPLLTVELAFDDRPFELDEPDADRVVRLRGRDVLWQKERLLNIGLQHLPDDCDKVAWLDADILFGRADWADETRRLLERHVVVQPFSHCVRLPRDVATSEPAMLPFGSGEGELFYGIVWGVRAKGRRSLRSYTEHGHTGFAWAARRELLERHGLYDANLLGNADTDIAHAMYGSTAYWGLCKLGAQARRHLRRWADPFAADVARSVAHVDGVLTHLWHGDQQLRLYDRPLDVLHDFDPEHDLELGPDGLYRWAGASRMLRTWSQDYFVARREDG